MRVKDIFVGLLPILILKVFFPWWLITIIGGAVALLAIWGWVTRRTGLGPVWSKRIEIMAIGIFVFSLTISLIDQKWPWLGKAIESRSLYSSFWVTDQTDPKYPETLAMAIYQTERMQIEKEEKKHQEILRSLQEKLAAGNKLNNFEQSQIKEAKERLSELDKKLADIRLSRSNSNGRAWFESIRTRTLLSKIFWFGTILLVAGLALKLTTKKKNGGLLIWLGGLALFLFLVLALFGQEIQAKRWQSISKNIIDSGVDSGIFHLTGTPGKGGLGVSKTTDGRELCYEPGQKVRLTQLKKVGKIGIINHFPGDPSWATTKKTIVSARAFTADCVELASLWGMELFVRVEIINPP